MNTEIQKQFVSFEIALKLKELGFDEPCLGWFIENDSYPDKKGDLRGTMLENPVKNKLIGLLSAPLLQQVIDWLNSKHNIEVSVFQLSKTQSAYGITFLECYPERYNEDDMYEYTNTTQIMNQIVLEEKRNIKIPSATEIAKENYSKYEATNKAIEQALKLIK